MKRKIVLKIGLTFFAFLVIISSCRRINEATELGDDLIPPIDNITTFDTSLTVLAFNDTFSLAMDSQRLRRNEVHFLGRINSDPFFGGTDARLFLQLKPLQANPTWVYPFARRDSTRLDSVVLVLSFVENYGDTNVTQTVNVYEMGQGNVFRADSTYLIRTNDFVYFNQLGSRTFAPAILDDSIKAFRDTSRNQLRIPLDTNFGRRLMNYDTTNAYRNDSAFNTYFKGFALQSMSSGQAIMGFSLISGATRLAFYYKIPKPGGGDSTVVTYFAFTGTSASANLIRRNYSGAPLAAAVGGSLPDPFIFIQNSPGSFATLKIPGLATLSNRLVHRAELIVEQVYHPLDTFFRPPDFLYVDVFDTTIDKYRSVPFDLSSDITGSLNFASFGIAPRRAVDQFGNPIRIWRFNLSRYVQHILTGTQSSYDLRLWAPFDVTNPFGVTSLPMRINPTIAKGRVRLAGNTGPTDTNPQRIRLRIVYSRL
ncbi:MAG TPA: DUF4270 family protein [Chitinophagaceae bacterium]|nr:DUF4270 family protein [Chitinophagaceae bacterium]